MCSCSWELMHRCTRIQRSQWDTETLPFDDGAVTLRVGSTCGTLGFCIAWVPLAALTALPEPYWVFPLLFCVIAGCNVSGPVVPVLVCYAGVVAVVWRNAECVLLSVFCESGATGWGHAR